MKLTEDIYEEEEDDEDEIWDDRATESNAKISRTTANTATESKATASDAAEDNAVVAAATASNAKEGSGNDRTIYLYRRNFPGTDFFMGVFTGKCMEFCKSNLFFLRRR